TNAALADGDYTATIKGSDAQGNEADDSDAFTVDVLPTVTIADITTTADNTPTFSGTSSNTSGNLTLTVNGSDYTVTPNADGTWS
ncbi:Biofilm associated protein, partial [Pseudomonas sp. PDM14]